MNKLTNNQNIENFKSNSFEWRLVQTDMKDKLGSEVYESWLKKISFIEGFNNYILLSVPTRFIRDWITSRYLDQILQIIKTYKKDIVRIEFRIVEPDRIVQNNESLVEDNLKENVSFHQWVGVLMGFSGAVLVIGFDVGKSLPLEGIISTLIALLAITISTIWQKKVSDNIPLAVNNMYQAIGAVLFHLIIIFFIFEKPFLKINTQFLLAMSHQVFLVSLLSLIHI